MIFNYYNKYLKASHGVRHFKQLKTANNQINLLIIEKVAGTLCSRNLLKHDIFYTKMISCKKGKI